MVNEYNCVINYLRLYFSCNKCIFPLFHYVSLLPCDLMQRVQWICHCSKFVLNSCSLRSFSDYNVITSSPFHCQTNSSPKSHCTRSEEYKRCGALIMLLYWEIQAQTNLLICISLNSVVSNWDQKKISKCTDKTDRAANTQFCSNLSHIHILYQNAFEQSKRDCHIISQVVGTDTHTFMNKFLGSYHILICFTHKQMSWMPSINWCHSKPNSFRLVNCTQLISKSFINLSLASI